MLSHEGAIVKENKHILQKETTIIIFFIYNVAFLQYNIATE